jgi:FdhE protein
MGKKKRAEPEKIRKAAAALKKARPAYEGLLDFYERLLLAQEASRKEVCPKPIKIPSGLLQVKKREGFPLIDTSEFRVDVKASEALLRAICRLAVGANEILAQAGPKIADAMDRGSLEASTLFSKILTEDADYWDEMEKRLGIDRKILAFTAYSSVRPSLCVCAEQLCGYLDKDAKWERGYCPICGSPPALSMIRKEGERFLCCSFCGHEWRTIRIGCPFCGNKDQKTLHYFFGEGEEDCRVHVCEQCNTYIKTIDTRRTERPIHPYVEQVSTLHLDMMAQEKGLKSGIPLWLQT